MFLFFVSSALFLHCFFFFVFFGCFVLFLFLFFWFCFCLFCFVFVCSLVCLFVFYYSVSREFCSRHFFFWLSKVSKRLTEWKHILTNIFQDHLVANTHLRILISLTCLSISVLYHLFLPHQFIWSGRINAIIFMVNMIAHCKSVQKLTVPLLTMKLDLHIYKLFYLQ